MNKDSQDVMSDDSHKTLQKAPFLSDLDQEEQRVVARACTPFSVERSAMLFRQGAVADGLYFIESGSIVLEARLPGDESLEVARLGPQEVLGELALIDGNPRAATATALADTAGRFYPSRAFRVLRDDRSPVARKILHRLCRIVCARIRETHARMNGSALPNGESTLLPGKTVRPEPPIPEECERPTAELSELHLGCIPFFRRFDDEQRRGLLGSMRCFELPRGHVLLEEGSAAACCWVVVRGAVEITVEGAGEERKLGVLGPGSLFGEMALIDDDVRSARARLREKSILLRLDREELDRILDSGSETAFKFFEIVSERLVENLRRSTRRAASTSAVGPPQANPKKDR